MRADVRLLKLLTPRTAVLALSALAACSPAFAQRDSLDSAFAGLPFDQWLGGGEQARMRWSTSVSRTRLSVHQRLLADVEIRLDGAEVARRRGPGQLLVLLQIGDQQGLRYQNHLTIDLAKVEEGVAKQDVVLTFTAFVTPGDYRVAVALYDTATREHSLKLDKLEVGPLRNDPLPGAWRDLPAVEFLLPADPPDSWYLPSMTGRLRLPLKPREPVEIELLVNLTPSELASSPEMRSRNLSVLVPALKAISELDRPDARLNVELLDLSRQRVVFRQDNVRVLDWTAMRRALAPGEAATIDLQSLERHRQSAAFFVAEIGRILGASHPSQRVLIVLSGPLAFERGVDLEPIALSPLPDGRVFYIRYHSFHSSPSPSPGPTRGSRYGLGSRSHHGAPPEPEAENLQFDQLESTLKPLAPRLFDVDTPEEFRRALASLLAEISNL
jgi:hypothetical protein